MSNGSPDGSKTIMSSSAEALFPFARVNCEKADEGEGRVELSSPRFQIITFDLREQVMKRGGGKKRGPGLVAGFTGACRNKVDPSPHRAPNCPRKKYSGIKVQKVVGIKSKPHKKLLP